MRVTIRYFRGGLGPEYEVTGEWFPGDPGVRTFSNGDPGYPGTGPEVKVSEIFKRVRGASIPIPPGQWHLHFSDDEMEDICEKLSDQGIEDSEDLHGDLARSEE
jgi:hypothetical protein